MVLHEKKCGFAWEKNHISYFYPMSDVGCGMSVLVLFVNGKEQEPTINESDLTAMKLAVGWFSSAKATASRQGWKRSNFGFTPIYNSHSTKFHTLNMYVQQKWLTYLNVFYVFIVFWIYSNFSRFCKQGWSESTLYFYIY